MIQRLLFSLIAMTFMSTAAMADTDISTLDNILYMKPTSIAAGTTGKLSINMKNSADVQAIGLYFYVPEGTVVASDDYGYFKELSTQRTSPRVHAIGSNYIEAKKEYRVALTTSTGAVFKGNDGEIFTIDLVVPAGMAPGDYTIKIAEQEFSNLQGILMNHGVFEGTITVTKADGVTDIVSDAANGTGDIYTVDGMKMQKLQDGFNIIRQKDGKTIKVAR